MEDTAQRQDGRDERGTGPSEEEAGEAVYIDWERFAGTDCVGFLILDDIRYPVMQAEDNITYLHALPDGSYNYAGSLFLYADNHSDFSDMNSFVYGHSMADGSMFGKLERYKDGKYANHLFFVYTPDGYQHTYRIFSVAQTEEGSRAYTYAFEGKNEIREYLNYMKEISLYPSGPEGSTSSHLVTLSTCDGYEGTSRRLIVQGIEVRRRKTQDPASWLHSGYTEIE